MCALVYYHLHRYERKYTYILHVLVNGRQISFSKVTVSQKAYRVLPLMTKKGMAGNGSMLGKTPPVYLSTVGTSRLLEQPSLGSTREQ